MSSDDTKTIFYRMEDNVFDLQFIFMIRMEIGQKTEFLRKLKAMRYMLRSHEILSNFNTAM